VGGLTAGGGEEFENQDQEPKITRQKMAAVGFHQVEKSYGSVKGSPASTPKSRMGSSWCWSVRPAARKSTLLRHAGWLKKSAAAKFTIDAASSRSGVEGPRHRDGVPELRVVSPHDGARQHGLSLSCAGPTTP